MRSILPCTFTLGLLHALSFSGSAVTPSSSPAQAEGRRLALVIGINEYESLPDLRRAVSDAWSVADVLKTQGKFDVTAVMDADSAALRAEVQRFASGIQSGDVVVVYYAGHGIQSSGRNYLIPADLPKDPEQLETQALRADSILKLVGSRGPAIKLLILDACRDNPLGGPAGLAQMEAAAFGEGTRIEFAAAAGTRAQDGLFAKHLVAEMPRPGLELEDVFRNVRRRVSEESDNAQITLSTHQMTVNFYFVGGELPGAEQALASLKQVAEALPRDDIGQTRAVESLIRNGRSLEGVDLLQGLTFNKAVFQGGDFARARMTAATLAGADLGRATFTSAEISFADLAGAQVQHAAMEDAALRFTDADAANFNQIEGDRTDWFAARARGASFAGARLRQAGFMFADLRDAVFDEADLSGAAFIGADLRGASFKGATFDNTDFTGALMDGLKLTKEQLSGGCETDSHQAEDGFHVIVIEQIPNQKFDGGYEYARFVDKRYPYNLLPNGFAPCGSRTIPAGGWFPVWKSQRGEHLRTEVGIRLSHRLLQQAGRRATVRERIERHFDWIWSVQK